MVNVIAILCLLTFPLPIVNILLALFEIGMTENKSAKKSLFCYLFFWCAVFVIGSCCIAATNKYEVALLENKIESGYSVYINGQEVDPANISIRSYDDITVDDNTQKIIIAT